MEEYRNDTQTQDALETPDPQQAQSEAREQYQHYYEPGQDMSSGEGRPPRRGIGGYIVTAVLSFLIGALCAALFLPRVSIEQDDHGFSVEVFPFEEGAPEASAAPAQRPTKTPRPSPTARPMPTLDGVAPVITESANPIPEIVEQISPSVIGVNGYAYSAMYGREMEGSLGSGFIISRDGYILTCAHIVADMDSITVTMPDGSEKDAEIMGTDKTLDVAVLKIEAEDLTPLKLGDSDSLRVGEFVIAIGDPTGRELSGTTTFGIVSAVARTVNIDGTSNVYIQTDAAVNPGSSGGALVNMKGEVVGITSAKTVTADYDEYGNAISAEGLGFATPINMAIDAVMQLITKGYIQYPGIGISVLTMDPESAKEYQTPEGIVVYSVTKDGPGEAAGLVVNDIITACDGEPMLDQDDFVTYIKAHKVGDTLALTVWRAGETIDTSITLGDLNALGDEIVDDAYADFEFHKK